MAFERMPLYLQSCTLASNSLADCFTSMASSSHFVCVTCRPVHIMLRAASFAQAVGQAMQLAGSMPDKVNICRKLSGTLIRALERLAVEVSCLLTEHSLSEAQTDQ